MGANLGVFSNRKCLHLSIFPRDEFDLAVGTDTLLRLFERQYLLKDHKMLTGSDCIWGLIN